MAGMEELSTSTCYMLHETTLRQRADLGLRRPSRNVILIPTTLYNVSYTACLSLISPWALAIYVGIYHGASAAAFFVRLM